MRARVIFASALMCLSPNAWAQGQTEHSADRFTNADVMAQTERDRRMWINGLVVGLSNGVALRDDEAGACVVRWYFDGGDTVYAQILGGMEQYPDAQPAVIVIAFARRACPAIAPGAG